jgi:hypothetical protein
MVYGASVHPAEELASWGLVSHVTAREAVILSQDLQHGVASLQRSGPGNATFANR